jgi:hypothetical protein
VPSLTGTRTAVARTGLGAPGRNALPGRQAVPGYWDDIVSQVGTGVSE